MLAESRINARESIHVEEIVGVFHVVSGNKHFETTYVNDVSVSGAGIQLSSPVEVGANIELTFAAGDWKISVEGKVIWCSLEDNEIVPEDRYRIGVKFNPRNANNNVIFFMASKSMVRPAV